MTINAMLEKYELVQVLNQNMLFTCLRVDRSTVPDDMYVYEVRHDDDCQGILCQIADRIMVNHWGTLLSYTPIDLGEPDDFGRRIIDVSEDDWDYTGETMGINDFKNYKKHVLPEL